MASHDVGVMELLALQIVGDCAHVLMEKPLLDTGLDLGDNRASVHSEVLSGALSEALLEGDQRSAARRHCDLGPDSAHDSVSLLGARPLAELDRVEKSVDGLGCPI